MVCLRESLPEVREQIQNLADKLGVDYGTAKIILQENNGYDLDKAPSGAESKLYQTLLEHYDGDERKALIAKAKTYLQPFFDWFGNWTDPDATGVSKVVDENGEPLVVWHGNRTNTPIREFNKQKIGSEHRPREISGFWFITDQRIAKIEYAAKPEFFGTGRVEFGETLPVFLNIKHPVIAEQLGIKVENDPYIGKYTSVQEQLNDFIHRAKQLSDINTDGYVLTMVDSDNDADDYRSKQTQLVVFDANQIKSIDNQGTYSTTDNNILHSYADYGDLTLEELGELQWKQINPTDATDTNAATVLNDMLSSNLFYQDEFLRDLATRFDDKFLKTVKVQFISRPNDKNMSYDPSTNTILIPREGITYFSSNSLSRALLHEIVHAYTVYNLANDPVFGKLIYDAWNHMKKLHPNEKPIGKYYFLKSAAEFVTEIYTKPEVRELIKQEYISWWDRFINGLAKLLNIKTQRTADAKVNEMIRQIDLIISERNEDPIRPTVEFDQLFSDSSIDENYQRHSTRAQEELQRQIDNFKSRGYRLDKQETIEKELSAIRKKMLSGMKSILKVVDQIGANKSDEFKANLKYQITNLQDNTISDIENIIYFIKTLSQDLVPVAQEILNAVKTNNVLTDERIHSLDRNYFGFYNPLIKEIKDIYSQLEPFSDIIDNETYRSIGNLLDSCNNILEFSRYNLRRMQVENYKQILAEKNINANSQHVEEMVDYLKGDVMTTDKDIWSITRLFMSPDKVNDKALKTLYQLVQEAENKKAQRVFEKAFEINKIAKNISSFTDFYEVDDDGKTTGYLVRDKQYGKFHKQYHDFLNKLRIQFGMAPNDETMSEDPEIRKEFAKAKNEWLSHRVERKYTKEFYELFDSLSTEAQYAREQIEIKIRTIQDKYKDAQGFIDKSKITKEDQLRLDELKVEKKLLASKYNPDGTEKTGIERKIADELTALSEKLQEGYVTVKDVVKFNKLVEEKRRTLSKEEFDKWYKQNTRVQYSQEFLDELKKIDKLRFGQKYAELSEQRNQLLAPYRNPQTNEPMVDLIPIVTKRAINRLEIEMMNERKKNKGKKVDTSGLYKVVQTSEYQRKRREAEKKAEAAATVNNVVDPFLFEQMMESMFYLQTSHRTVNGWQPNSYYTKIVPVNPDHLEIVPSDNFNMLSPDSKFYNKNYDYDSTEFYQPKSFATEDFVDENGKKIKKGQKLYDNKEAYNKIISDVEKKNLYDTIVNLIEESNSYYSNRTFMNKYKLPQIDGSTYRYMKGKGILKGLLSKIGSYFGRRVDDVGIQEEASTAPDGQKLSMIPQYFTKDLDDPSTISADLIGIIMEYYQAAVNFDEKSKIKAQAETIKSVLSRRIYKKTRFNKQEDVIGTSTDIFQMADQFIDTHIYGMTNRAIKWRLFGREVDVTKTVKLLGSFATSVNLMMNYAVAATGLFTSGYQMLVQTCVGRYWDVNDTWNAARFFVTDMFWTGIRNIGNRHYKSKQWALMDMFGIGSDLNSLWKNSNHNGFVSALMRRLGWWGMTISDYCTKGQILDAIMFNFKYVNGEFICKEDYFAKYGKTDETKSNWRKYQSAMDCIEFKNGKITTVDESMNDAWNKAMPIIGNTARALAYASDGQLTPLQKAQFTVNAFGGLVMMHRQYIPVVLSERFTLEYQYDPNLNRYREAVTRSVWRYISAVHSDRKELGLYKAMVNNWTNDVVIRSNARQALTEAILLLGVLPQLTAFMLKWADEDDENWFKKFFAYVAMRTQFESTSPYNIFDLYNTIKTPTPAYGPFDNLTNLFSTSWETIRKIIAGEDLTEDEVERGAYEGKSQLFKSIMKVTPLKNIYEQLFGIDDKMRYYQNQIMKEEFEELE